jgi:hypothetical protein
MLTKMTFHMVKSCAAMVLHSQIALAANAMLAARLTLRGIHGASAYNSKIKDSSI